MALRSDHRIAVEALHYRNEAFDVLRIEFHVGINEGHQVATGVGNPAAERVAFSHIAVVFDDLNIGQDHTLGLAGRLIGAAMDSASIPTTCIRLSSNAMINAGSATVIGSRMERKAARARD